MSITTEQVQNLTGKVYSQNSAKIGSVGQIYLDDESGQPTWATVKTGLFGSSEAFVPLDGARVDGNDVYLDFDEDKIKNAPRIEPDGSLSPQEEDELYTYYGLSSGSEQPETDARHSDQDDAEVVPVATGQGYPADNTDDTRVTADDAPADANDAPAEANDAPAEANDAPADADDVSERGDERQDMAADTVGADRSGPTTDDAMTRSEERLNVGTAARESGRARLRKYVTTETVTQDVPVQHEEVTLEREPITADNADAATSGAEISEEEHEVVLNEEVPVVEKDVVAMERVKLGKETVTENQTVSEDVRKEQIDMVDPNSEAETADQH